MSYASDREWSDRFIEPIKQIIGPHLLVTAPDRFDRAQAADLMVLTIGGRLAVAARVRRHAYIDKYPWEFTIRTHRDNGAKTELAKIEEGFGDWLVYGFADPTATRLDRWALIDLEVFRRGLRRGKIVGQLGDNHDGTYFQAFDLRRCPRSLLIASSHPLPPQQPRLDLGEGAYP